MRFNHEVLHKAHLGFQFQRASVGNLFLAGAMVLCGSLPGAIFLFTAITGISQESVQLVPVINTTERCVLAAELRDGTLIVGQSEISHPPERAEASPVIPKMDYLTAGLAGARLGRASTPLFEPPVLGAETVSDISDDDDADGGDAAHKSRNVFFSKGAVPSLPSPIARV